MASGGLPVGTWQFRADTTAPFPYSAPEYIPQYSMVFIKDDSGEWKACYADAPSFPTVNPLDNRVNLRSFDGTEAFTSLTQYEAICLQQTNEFRNYVAPNPRLLVFPDFDGAGNTAVVIAAKAGYENGTSDAIGTEHCLRFWVAHPPVTGDGDFKPYLDSYSLPMNPAIPVFDIDAFYSTESPNGEIAAVYTFFDQSALPIVYDAQTGPLMPDIQLNTVLLISPGSPGSSLAPGIPESITNAAPDPPSVSNPNIDTKFVLARGRRQDPTFAMVDNPTVQSRSSICIHSTRQLLPSGLVDRSASAIADNFVFITFAGKTSFYPVPTPPAPPYIGTQYNVIYMCWQVEPTGWELRNSGTGWGPLVYPQVAGEETTLIKSGSVNNNESFGFVHTMAQVAPLLTVVVPTQPAGANIYNSNPSRLYYVRTDRVTGDPANLPSGGVLTGKNHNALQSQTTLLSDGFMQPAKDFPMIGTLGVTDMEPFWFVVQQAGALGDESIQAGNTALINWEGSVQGHWQPGKLPNNENMQWQSQIGGVGTTIPTFGYGNPLRFPSLPMCHNVGRISYPLSFLGAEASDKLIGTGTGVWDGGFDSWFYQSVNPGANYVNSEPDRASRTANFNDTFYISGAQLHEYDGKEVREAGFITEPVAFIVEVPAAAGQLIEPGQYEYTVVYEWTTATGRRYFSGQSNDRSNSLIYDQDSSGTTNPSIYVWMPQLTNKRDLSRANHERPVSCRVVIYRNNVDERIPKFKLFTFPMTEHFAPSQKSVAFADPIPDRWGYWGVYVEDKDEETQDSNRELGIADGICPYDAQGAFPTGVPPYAPESCYDLAVHQQALFVSSTSGELYASLKPLGSIGTIFPSYTILPFHDRDFPITHIATAGGFLAALNSQGGWRIGGDGNTQLEALPFAPPEAILKGQGPPPYGFIGDTPLGVFFSTSQGLYLIRPDSSVLPTGVSVEDFIQNGTPAADPIVHPEEQLVIFPLKNYAAIPGTLMLVYSYFYDMWGTWNVESLGDSAGAVSWMGENGVTHTYIGTFGGSVLRYKNQPSDTIAGNVFEDVSSTGTEYQITQKATTGWIQFPDVGESFRCYALKVIGKLQNDQAVDIRVDISYNFGPFGLDSHVFAITPGDPTAVEPIELLCKLKKSKLKAVKVRVWCTPQDPASPVEGGFSFTSLTFEVGQRPTATSYKKAKQLLGTVT